jgi:hypothetical protein
MIHHYAVAPRDLFQFGYSGWIVLHEMFHSREGIQEHGEDKSIPAYG